MEDLGGEVLEQSEDGDKSGHREIRRWDGVTGSGDGMESLKGRRRRELWDGHREGNVIFGLLSLG